MQFEATGSQIAQSLASIMNPEVKNKVQVAKGLQEKKTRMLEGRQIAFVIYD